MKNKIRMFPGVSEKNLDQADSNRLNNYKERFRIWQGRQIDLVNWSIGILLTLNIAAIGYWVSLSTNQKFSGLNLCCIPVSLFALVFLIISLIIGTIILWIRLNDFRKTLEITKLKTLKFKVEKKLTYYSDKEEDTDQITEKIISLRSKNQRLGTKTHFMYKAQLIFFLLGLLLIIAAIL